LLSDLGGGYRGAVSYRADRLSLKDRWDGGVSAYPLEAELEWRLGFVWQTSVSYHFALGQPFTITSRLIVMPYWFPAAVFALAPHSWAIRTRRRLGLLGVMILVAAIAVFLACLRPPAGS
jgi:hypothetical protein